MLHREHNATVVSPPSSPLSLGARARRIGRNAAIALAVTAATGLGLRAVARFFLFPRHRVAAVTPPRHFEVVRATAEGGVPVNMLFLPPPDARARTVVVFHGNAEAMTHSTWLGDALRARGLGALLVEYRGYGVSAASGDPSEEGLYADAEAALEALRARGVDPARTVLFGYSLGSGVAAEMAHRGRASALVLVAPFTSVPAVVTDVAPIFPARLVVRDAFDTLSKAHDIRMPTLVIHGDRDQVVPFWMGKKLSEEVPGARFIAVPGGRHGDLFGLDRERLLAAIVDIGA